MHASILYDASISFFTVGIWIVIYTLFVSVIEAIVMFFMKWGKFWRCLWVSLLMNVISTIFGLVLVEPVIGWMNNLSTWMVVAYAFLLSVIIEGGVLMLIKRNAARQNWLVSLVANIASYLLIILPLAWLNA